MPGPKPAYVQVAESFSVGDAVYTAGTVYSANHPVARKHKAMFRPLVVAGEDVVEETTAAPESHERVEQTTAAPGEKRNV